MNCIIFQYLSALDNKTNYIVHTRTETNDYNLHKGRRQQHDKLLVSISCHQTIYLSLLLYNMTTTTYGYRKNEKCFQFPIRYITICNMGAFKTMLCCRNAYESCRKDYR